MAERPVRQPYPGQARNRPGAAIPGSAIYVATRDINLQRKLAAVGLPFIEAP